MKALLLAAGLGTRLRPLSAELPKPVWPLFNVPLAAHVLAQLKAAGVDDVVVNLHYLPHLLQRALISWVPDSVHLRWSPETEILGTGGALQPWRSHFAAETFWVANADTYQDIDLTAMLQSHRRSGAAVTLAVRPLAAGATGPIEIDPEGRIVRFLNCRLPGSRGGRMCDFSGVHLIEPEWLRQLPPGRCCINADVHAPLLERGAAIFGYSAPGSGFWSDLGTPRRYLDGHRALLAAGCLPPLADGRLVAARAESLPGGGGVHPPSFLGAGVELAAGARVGPRAVLGRDVRIGRGAVVVDSVLWPGVRIAPGEQVVGQIRSASGARVAVAQANPFNDSCQEADEQDGSS